MASSAKDACAIASPVRAASATASFVKVITVIKVAAVLAENE
jgi:hypothetical protein